MAKGIFKRLVGSWSLESKSLLLLGGALLISIFCAFYAAQNVAERLTMETTRTAARHFANFRFYLAHAEQKEKTQFKVDDESKKYNDNLQKLKGHLKQMMLQSNYEIRYLWFEEGGKLEDVIPVGPELESENILLEKLREDIEKARKQEIASQTSQPASLLDGPLIKDETRNGAYSIGSPDQKSEPYREAVSNAGYNQYYQFYQPIFFESSCLDCHVYSTPGGQIASSAPFIAVRVKMPYDATSAWRVWSFAWMIAIAIATLAVTLFAVHWILKRLIIRPLRHLRDVSNEISRGRIGLRAVIDTGDEFHELAEAFNRMIRHLTDTQSQLQDVNSELDRRVDQLAQANLQLYEGSRLKSDFLANMSHELRTPLNSIIGFSDVLQKFDSLNEKQKRFAANIQNSGRLLLEMINDILDLAKVEAGKMEVRPTHFELGKVVSGQCEIVRSLSDQKNIDIQIESTIADLSIYQDQAKLQQILTNLLSNAIKFTPEGGLITVSTGLVNDDRCYLTVADTGVGIAEEDFEIIFEKFRQSSTIVRGDGLTREYSGTGLGLSIVRELCKLLGGEISLKSELGKGSTFRVVLPTHYQPVDTIDLVPPVVAHRSLISSDGTEAAFEPFS